MVTLSLTERRKIIYLMVPLLSICVMFSVNGNRTVIRMKQRNVIRSGHNICSSKSSKTMQMRLSSSTIIAVFTVFLLNPTSIIGADEPNSTDFIRTSCNETLYPDVCFCSLSSYANSVHQDLGQLAEIAISVTLNNAQNMASFISNLTHRHPSPSVPGDNRGARTTAAIQDCASNLGDAIDEIRGSLKQMRQLRSEPAPSSEASFRFQMSNVQTWMSAALTDEETCTDGFDDVPDDNDGVKADLCGRAAEVKKLTSNALALVNSYTNKQQ